MESQPVQKWRAKALSETDPDGALAALTALARVGSNSNDAAMVDRLLAMPFGNFHDRQKIEALFLYQRCFDEESASNQAGLSAQQRTSIVRGLDPHYPDRSQQVNYWLSRILAPHEPARFVERTMALSDALNQELGRLADAGCPVIQMEEPQIHMTPIRGDLFGKLGVRDLVDIFNNTVKGLGDKTEIWCHTCWGNPSQQRVFDEVQSYQPTLEALNEVEADVLTFETCSSGTGDLKAIGEIITGKKIAIGVIDHHTLQVERPEQVADLIREALKHIPAERLVISSDCGMGREGMSRRHASYKMVAMVQGTNIVRNELGLPLAKCLAEDQRYSLAAEPG